MADDMTFDPEIHATDKEGNPSVNRDGSFRKKRRDAGAGRRKSSSARTTGGQRGKYEDGVSGLLQIPAAVLAVVNPVDGYCVAEHTPPIAKAVADLATERPEVAAALDRVLAVGPYGALLGAVLPLAFQLAHNHGVIPEPMAKAMGATPKRDLERRLRMAMAPKPKEGQENVAA